MPQPRIEGRGFKLGRVRDPASPIYGNAFPNGRIARAGNKFGR